MLDTRKLTAGRKGTKKLHEQAGDRLFCVRYRYDNQRRKRYKTVKLIVEATDWTPPPAPFAAALGGVRVELAEVDLQRRIKQVGGKWNRVWDLAYDQAAALGLADRIASPKVSTARHPQIAESR